MSSDRIPIGIVDGKEREHTPKASKPKALVEPKNKPATWFANAPRALKIFAKDVEKYEVTPGCRACTEIILGRNRGKGVAT